MSALELSLMAMMNRGAESVRERIAKNAACNNIPERVIAEADWITGQFRLEALKIFETVGRLSHSKDRSHMKKLLDGLIQKIGTEGTADFYQPLLNTTTLGVMLTSGAGNAIRSTAYERMIDLKSLRHSLGQHESFFQSACVRSKAEHEQELHYVMTNAVALEKSDNVFVTRDLSALLKDNIIQFWQTYIDSVLPRTERGELLMRSAKTEKESELAKKYAFVCLQSFARCFANKKMSAKDFLALQEPMIEGMRSAGLQELCKTANCPIGINQQHVRDAGEDPENIRWSLLIE